MGLDLKLIRLAIFTRLLFIANFNKNELAKFTKSSRGRETTTAPQGLMAFFNCRN